MHVTSSASAACSTTDCSPAIAVSAVVPGGVSEQSRLFHAQCNASNRGLTAAFERLTGRPGATITLETLCKATDSTPRQLQRWAVECGIESHAFRTQIYFVRSPRPPMSVESTTGIVTPTSFSPARQRIHELMAHLGFRPHAAA